MQKNVWGFTLLELLIVITILGFLVMIAVIRYGNLLENSRASVAYVTLSNIIGAEKAYYWDQEPPAYTNNLTALGFPTNPSVSDNYFVDDYFNYSFNIPAVGAPAAFALRRLVNGVLKAQKSYKMDIDGEKSSAVTNSYW